MIDSSVRWENARYREAGLGNHRYFDTNCVAEELLAPLFVTPSESR